MTKLEINRKTNRYWINGNEFICNLYSVNSKNELIIKGTWVLRECYFFDVQLDTLLSDYPTMFDYEKNIKTKKPFLGLFGASKQIIPKNTVVRYAGKPFTVRSNQWEIVVNE